MKRVRNFWKLQFYWVIPSFIDFALCKRVKFVLGSILQSHSEQPSSSYCSSDRRRKSAWETCWDNSLQKKFTFQRKGFARVLFKLWASQVILVVKIPPDNSGDVRNRGLISGSRGSPGGGHGNPLQYSCLKNSMDRGAQWATVSIGLQRGGRDLAHIHASQLQKENSSHSPKLSFLN